MLFLWTQSSDKRLGYPHLSGITLTDRKLIIVIFISKLSNAIGFMLYTEKKFVMVVF